MKFFLSIAFVALTATQAMAEYVRVEAAGSVQETADRLVAAVEGAGATVFARVPHSKGAMSVDMDVAAPDTREPSTKMTIAAITSR